MSKIRDEIYISPDEIREIRKMLGVSQGQFCRLLGVSLSALHNWEQGVNKPNTPTIILLKLLALRPELLLHIQAILKAK
jgi:DNA-binding transcriptional regulator YiaG